MAALIPILLVACSCLTALVVAENVTTVFQLQETSSGVLDSSGTWRVVSNGPARGLPLRRGKEGLRNVWAGQECCESWSQINWSKLPKSEAQNANPPLELASFESASAISQDDSAGDGARPRYKEDAGGVWRGQLSTLNRARLHFTPPETARSTVGIFLCEREDSEDIECVAILLTGSSPDGKLLRFQATRYGSRQPGSRRPTPYGNMKTAVQYRDDRVREGWLGDQSYNFHIERTSQGYLEVRLDGGDPSQRRTMSIPAEPSFIRLSVSILASPGSDRARRLEVRNEPAWYGELSLGASMYADYTPSANGTGHLGFAFCEDRFQERCTSVVFDGFSGGTAKIAETPYWTAGFEEAQSPMPESSKKAKWEPVEKRRFSIHRAHDGTVNFAITGDTRKHSYTVPLSYQYVVIENYKGEGSKEVITPKEALSADVWKLNSTEGVLRSPPIAEWFAQNDICVSVVARMSEDSKMIVTIQRLSDNEGKRIGLLRGSDGDPQWIKKRFILRRSLILQRQKVQIVVETEQPEETRTPVLLQWVAACDPDAVEDRVSLPGVSPTSSVTDAGGFRTLEFPEPEALPPLNNSVCSNEGLLHMEKGKCLCRPGFTGRLCERGCGPNRFGEECASRCSLDSSARQCRGTWLCTTDFPCDCGPGLTGPRCDQVCPEKFYGIGCRQTCGHCAADQPCDPYTGWCTTGCKGGLQPPFCRDTCGTAKKVTSLIVHGTEVAAERYPWHVAVFNNKAEQKAGAKTNGSTITYICGGTVLTPTIVVSAAHCFHNERSPPQKLPASQFQVSLGKTKRVWDANEEHEDRVQRRNVLVIHTPEFYSGISGSFQDDLAVLELDSPLDFTEYVSPICFDYLGKFDEPLVAGAVGRVAGWGTTSEGVPSDVLKDAALPYVPQIDCLKQTPFDFRAYASARDKFCGGEPGPYVDRGDSGGGYIFADPRSGAWYLRGVVSVRPSSVLYYAAYTNVSFHRNYILELIQQADMRTAQNNYWGISGISLANKR